MKKDKKCERFIKLLNPVVGWKSICIVYILFSDEIPVSISIFDKGLCNQYGCSIFFPWFSLYDLLVNGIQFLIVENVVMSPSFKEMVLYIA